MGVGTLISLEEYLNTTYRPDCDFVEGHVLERNVGKKKHGYAQGEVHFWFRSRKDQMRLQPIPELRMRVAHAVTLLAPVARGAGPIGDWRDTWLAVTLAVHELEGVLMLIRKQLP